MQVGGFRHGDVIREIDGDESVVIGVAVDRKGSPQLYMRLEGRHGAGLHPHPKLLRCTAEVVDKRDVLEFQPEPSESWSPEFLSGMRFTFRYPVGLGLDTSCCLFDVQ